MTFSHSTHSVSNPFDLLCAFIRGILLQLSSRVKKQRSQKLKQLLSDIKQMEAHNKANPDTVLMHKLNYHYNYIFYL